MRNFQDTFETRKCSFICAFSICMTVPSKHFVNTENSYLIKNIIFAFSKFEEGAVPTHFTKKMKMPR